MSCVPTRADAERVELDLRRRLALGELYEEGPRTLGQEINAALARIRVGRSAGDRTVEFNDRCSRIWKPFFRRPVPTLRRAEIEDFIEGYNQPTYRGMRINGVRVATWSSRDEWSRGSRPDAEWLQ